MLRLRSLLWGSASSGNVALYGRLGNEFRVYTSRSGEKKDGMSTYDFPDELYIDSLYLDIKDLFGDRLDLRIGRQDMKFGASRLISDGSAGDGARAAYFNAVKVTLRLTDKTELRAFGIHMPDHDKMAIGPYRSAAGRWMPSFFMRA